MATGGGPSMEEEEKQNFTRIQIALLDCGIAVLKELFLQRVRDLSPPNQPNGCLTVDEFLYEHMNVILRSIGNDKHKKSILYPFRQNTDIEEWDIPLFIHVLLAACDISTADGLLRQDITNLCNLRNKLCHTPHHKLSAVIYNAYLGRVRGSINRICVFLNNQTLTQNVNETLDKYESLTHAYPNDVLEEYVKNNDIVSEDDLAVTGALEQIKQLINDTEIQMPAIELVMLFRHYNQEDEEKVSNYLRDKFAKAIQHSTLQEGASQAVADTDQEERDEQGDEDRDIAEQVKHLVQELFRDKRRVTYVNQSCVILGIQVPDIGSAITLIEEVISGKMYSLFAPLEELMRTRKRHGLFDIYLTMERKTCYSFLNEILSQIAHDKDNRMTSAFKHSAESVDAVGCMLNPSSNIEMLHMMKVLNKKERYQTFVDTIRKELSIPFLEMKVFIKLAIAENQPAWQMPNIATKTCREDVEQTPWGYFRSPNESAHSSPQDPQCSSTSDDHIGKYLAKRFRNMTEHVENPVNIKQCTQRARSLKMPKYAKMESETTDAPTLKYVGEMKLLGTKVHGRFGGISGMAVVGDRFLVAADNLYECLRCFDMDSRKQHVEWHDSGFLPWDITTIPGNRVAVTSGNEVWFLHVTEKGDLLFENKINVEERWYGIASSGDNLIVGHDHEVHMLDMQGNVIKKFGRGDDMRLFEMSTSVAVSPDHCIIYVADKANNTVTALSQCGRFLGGVDVRLDLSFRASLTVDIAGRLYVCGHKTVFLVYPETGTVIPLLGTMDLIKTPSAVAVCDKTQRLYVSSLNSNVIQVFEMPKHTTA